jgi:hypothetical protein
MRRRRSKSHAPCRDAIGIFPRRHASPFPRTSRTAAPSCGSPPWIAPACSRTSARSSRIAVSAFRTPRSRRSAPRSTMSSSSPTTTKPPSPARPRYPACDARSTIGWKVMGALSIACRRTRDTDTPQAHASRCRAALRTPVDPRCHRRRREPRRAHAARQPDLRRSTSRDRADTLARRGARPTTSVGGQTGGDAQRLRGASASQQPGRPPSRRRGKRMCADDVPHVSNAWIKIWRSFAASVRHSPRRLGLGSPGCPASRARQRRGDTRNPGRHADLRAARLGQPLVFQGILRSLQHP